MRVSEGPRMRRFLSCLVLAALLPIPAAAERGECRKITRQIAHFETVAERAHDRDNELWEQATLQHIDRLATRRARLCPEYVEPGAGELISKALRLASKAAVRYFTGGF